MKGDKQRNLATARVLRSFTVSGGSPTSDNILLFLRCQECQMCIQNNGKVTEIKTDSTRKLNNFNSQRSKTLYQNNLKNIAFFFTFFLRPKDVISHL